MNPTDFSIIETERLILRAWREADRAPWAEMNADPRVREFFPGLSTREQSDAAIAYYSKRQEQNGFTFWAAEEKATGAFMGFAGLDHVDFDAPFTPAVEIGWRLAHSFWGCGFASEAARASLDFGFRVRGLGDIVAFTTAPNHRSRRLMERLGMARDPAEDFIHPKMPPGHPLQPCVLYHMSAERWHALSRPGVEKETLP